MTYYVMGVGGGGVQNPLLPTRKKFFFDEKWMKEKGEIGGRCLHFLHC